MSRASGPRLRCRISQSVSPIAAGSDHRPDHAGAHARGRRTIPVSTPFATRSSSLTGREPLQLERSVENRAAAGARDRDRRAGWRPCCRCPVPVPRPQPASSTVAMSANTGLASAMRFISVLPFMNSGSLMEPCFHDRGIRLPDRRAAPVGGSACAWADSPMSPAPVAAGRSDPRRLQDPRPARRADGGSRGRSGSDRCSRRRAITSFTLRNVCSIKEPRATQLQPLQVDPAGADADLRGEQLAEAG